MEHVKESHDLTCIRACDLQAAVFLFTHSVFINHAVVFRKYYGNVTNDRVFLSELDVQSIDQNGHISLYELISELVEKLVYTSVKRK
jgi:hypothetical protein